MTVGDTFSGCSGRRTRAVRGVRRPAPGRSSPGATWARVAHRAAVLSLTAPSTLGLARAYVQGDLDIHDDEGNP